MSRTVHSGTAEERVTRFLREHEPFGRTVDEVAAATGLTRDEAHSALLKLTLGNPKFPGACVGRGKGGAAAYWWSS